MNPVRKQRLLTVLGVLIGLALTLFFVLRALNENINLFYSPSELLASHTQKFVRMGGMVVKNSVKREPNSLRVTFELTDFKQTIPVMYEGVLPDLFREGQGIVTRGQLQNGTFIATEVLAKHDENYMPSQIKSTLKNEAQHVGP